jgi:hypothetical protein
MTSTGIHQGREGVYKRSKLVGLRQKEVHRGFPWRESRGWKKPVKPGFHLTDI